MLRTLFVLLLISAGIKYSFQGAFYVLTFYLWNAYFRPEQWVWSSLIEQLRLSMTIGVALLAVTFFSTNRFRGGTGPLLLAAFLSQTLIATAFSPVSAVLWPQWIEFAKVVIVCYLIVTLVDTEDRLRLVLIVIGLSLGFEGARQGWSQLLVNPGRRNLNEWPMLGDNNGVAIGMLMLFPLLVALAQTTRDRSRWVAWFLACGVLYRGLSTYSRGGFLAASGMAMHYAFRAKHRLAAMAAVIVFATAVSYVMPDAYWERISSVGNAAETTEANRIGFWMIGRDMANDYPFTGVGLDGYRHMYDSYDPTVGEHGQMRNIHSSWFGLLSEVGYPGLCLFLMLIATTVFTARRARRMAKLRPDVGNLAIYATLFEAQILTFAIGGTFITLQYKEFIWHVFALSMAANRILQDRMRLRIEGTPGVLSHPEVAMVNPAVLERLRRRLSTAGLDDAHRSAR